MQWRVCRNNDFNWHLEMQKHHCKSNFIWKLYFYFGRICICKGKLPLGRCISNVLEKIHKTGNYILSTSRNEYKKLGRDKWCKNQEIFSQKPNGFRSPIKLLIIIIFKTTAGWFMSSFTFPTWENVNLWTLIFHCNTINMSHLRLTLPTCPAIWSSIGNK